MSSPRNKNLSKEKVQQLLAAIGRSGASDESQKEAAEYDWRQPHHSGRQLKKLNIFTRNVATVTTEKVASLYEGDYSVQIASTTLHFADEFLAQNPTGEQGNYCLAFGACPDHPCGFITMTAKTACALASQLLGEKDGSEEGSDRNLSKLEKSLLLDIFSVFVEAFCICSGDREFLPAASIVEVPVPIELTGTEELCRITLEVQKAESEEKYEVQAVIVWDELEPVVGKDASENMPTDEPAAQDAPKAMLEHLSAMPVLLTAQLGSAHLTFEEAMDLQVNDILLLDQRIDEPVELVARNQSLFVGRPAKSAGRYAVVVTKIRDVQC